MEWVTVALNLFTSIMIILIGQQNMRRYKALREENLDLRLRITTLELQERGGKPNDHVQINHA